jgi:hypothetical protein
MSEPRVLLFTLSERTSAKGSHYLTGWLGKCKLVGFKSKTLGKRCAVPTCPRAA